MAGFNKKIGRESMFSKIQTQQWEEGEHFYLVKPLRWLLLSTLCTGG